MISELEKIKMYFSHRDFEKIEYYYNCIKSFLTLSRADLLETIDLIDERCNDFREKIKKNYSNTINEMNNCLDIIDIYAIVIVLNKDSIVDVKDVTNKTALICFLMANFQYINHLFGSKNLKNEELLILLEKVCLDEPYVFCLFYNRLSRNKKFISCIPKSLSLFQENVWNFFVDSLDFGNENNIELTMNMTHQIDIKIKESVYDNVLNRFDEYVNEMLANLNGRLYFLSSAYTQLILDCMVIRYHENNDLYFEHFEKQIDKIVNLLLVWQKNASNIRTLFYINMTYIFLYWNLNNQVFDIDYLHENKLDKLANKIIFIKQQHALLGEYIHEDFKENFGEALIDYTLFLKAFKS